MPVIKSSADLRNNYNGFSEMCHSYDELKIKFELYTEIEKRFKRH
ncbi:MAG: hypothetical protein Q4B60_03065 [Erysipelotrichaceae bacterium]|nr:hypothetical protein [Erysipelotrichaceae bacterium]